MIPHTRYCVVYKRINRVRSNIYFYHYSYYIHKNQLRNYWYGLPTNSENINGLLIQRFVIYSGKHWVHSLRNRLNDSATVSIYFNTLQPIPKSRKWKNKLETNKQGGWPNTSFFIPVAMFHAWNALGFHVEESSNELKCRRDSFRFELSNSGRAYARNLIKKRIKQLKSAIQSTVLPERDRQI